MNYRNQPIGRPVIIPTEKGEELREVEKVPTEKDGKIEKWYGLPFDCYSVHVKDARSADWEKYTLTWTPYGFNVTYPPTQDNKSRNPLCKATVKRKGDKTGSMPLANFTRFLVTEFGKEMGAYIGRLFLVMPVPQFHKDKVA